MLNDKELNWIFGKDVYLSEELVNSTARFTLAFSYAESKIMNCNSTTRNARVYAEETLAINGFNFKKYVNYFSERYSKEIGFQDKLMSLCNSDNHSLRQISESFGSSKSSEIDLLESLFRVCIRLRNNLFHGEKWAYMLRGQEDNFNIATSFIVDVLRHRGE